jgi:hypothetical protein
VRAIKRGFLAEPARLGRFRLFDPADLPRIAEALRAAGYSPTTPTTEDTR